MLTGRPLLSSSSATQVYFNIEHPAILDLISSEVLSETTNNMPKLVRSIQSGLLDDDFEKVNVDKLFDTRADKHIKVSLF